MVVLVALLGCASVAQRFPGDVQASLAHDDIRRLETERFIIYYPAHRRAEIDRFLLRATRCADVLREAAVRKNWAWQEKMVIVMPDTAYNNAFASAGEQGFEQVSLIPTMATYDFTTEYGLLPDPGMIACHELVHYVHLQQIGGLWSALDHAFGPLFTPQSGADPWFLEGLATHYEAALSPGIGRPRWPIFTGMFAAGYAGEHIGGGDLSIYNREALSVGNHYLVGTMFVRYLTERYGELPVWAAISSQASAVSGLLFAGTFRDGFHRSLGDLLDEFDEWHAKMFPVRQRPAGQRLLATLGNDARYARGRDGTEAWVAYHVDEPPRLVVRAPDGATLAELSLLDIVPPRTLISASPLLVSGLSVTADGREVWLTVNDRDTVEHVPRLLRWRRGDERLTELTHTLGPGATIDPAGATYYYCAVDGDRWSLAAWDVQRGTRRLLIDAAPGTYMLGAQVSADGARLVVDAWDGHAFVAWLIDAATGARLGEIRGSGTPIWDASFTDDGRVMYLGEIDGRFQLMIDGAAVTDAPYAVLAARSARGTIRFLNREGWNWTLDEVAAPAPAPAETAAGGPAAAAPAVAIAPPSAAPAVLSDEPYSPWERFLVPQVRSPIVAYLGQQAVQFGVILAGGDRLGLQRWVIAGHVQPPTDADPTLHGGGEVAYLNTMLAPWQIVAAGDVIDWSERVTMEGSTVTRLEQRRTRDAVLSVSRVWRDSLLARLSGVYTRDFDRPPDQPGVDRRLGGPAVALDWFSGEATAYAGLRRALLGSMSAAYYPHALSSFAGDIYDVGGSLGAVVPLPFGARHTLTLGLRGRALVAQSDTGLLQLGGLSARNPLVNGSSVATTHDFDDARFPPNLRFTEYLRGYEDYAITTDRAAIASLSWLYPLIIDRGFVATLGFLPSSFVRQIDLELFATGAIDRRRVTHAAAGGELTLELTFWRLSAQLGYQVARRVRDDHAVTQLLELTLTL